MRLTLRGIVFGAVVAAATAALPISLSANSRVFDGIGAISGDGATSRLVYDFPNDTSCLLYTSPSPRD